MLHSDRTVVGISTAGRFALWAKPFLGERKTMNRFALVVMFILAVSPFSFAQDDANHGEIGIFGDLFRHERFDKNHLGLGGRVSFNVHPNVALEGELSYSFAHAYDQEDGIEIDETDVRALHGLFGPKFQTTGEAARAFFVVKGGFVTFSLDEPATIGGVAGTLDDLRDQNTRFALFPGAGFEFFLGPVGIRFDAGDELYWLNDKAHHNLKVTFGPHIQF